MNPVDELQARKSRNPGLVRTSSSANLGDDDETSGVGMQRLADQLIRDMRTIEVAGVNVIYSSRDRLPQHGQCRVAIIGRPEHAGAGELHGTVAHPVHGYWSTRKREFAAELGFITTCWVHWHFLLLVAC